MLEWVTIFFSRSSRLRDQPQISSVSALSIITEPEALIRGRAKMCSVFSYRVFPRIIFASFTDEIQAVNLIRSPGEVDTKHDIS